MRKSHAFERVDPSPSATEPVLTTADGLIPPEITPEGSGRLQLDLDMFG